MASEGRIIEVVLGTECSDYDRRTSDNKLGLKPGADSSHGKSVHGPIWFVILQSVYHSRSPRDRERMNRLVSLKGKGVVFKITQYPVRRIARNVLHFTPRQTCSFRHQLDFSGNHSANCSYIYSQFHYIYIYILSFIQVNWSDLEKAKMAKLRNSSKGDSNSGSLE